MALNLSYAPKPPWLENDAQESNFLRDYQTGRQMAQQAQEFPLKIRALQQEEQLRTLKTTELLRQRDQQLEAELQLQQVGEQLAPLMKEGKYLQALDALMQASAHNPNLRKAPAWESMVKDAQFAVDVETARQKIAAQGTMRTKEEKLKFARDRALEEGDTEGAEYYQKAMDAEAERLAQAKARLVQGDVRLRQQEFWNRERIAQSAARLNISAIDLAKELQEANITVEEPPTVPGAPGEPAKPLLPTLKMGERPPTTANITEAQQEMNAAVLAVGSISKAIDAVEKNPDAAGAVGWLKELYEGVGGQLGLDPGTRITDARTYMRDTANQLTSALRVDVGAMSDWEQKLLEAIPGLLDKTASADTIKTRLRIINRLMAGKAFRNAPILRKSPPPALLEALTTEDLADAIKAGYITLERGVQEYDRRKGR